MKITNEPTLKKLRFVTLPKDYRSLCSIHLPRPIRNRHDYSEAEKMADTMAGFEERMTSDQSDYFAVVTGFMADYENEASPHVSPAEALAFLMAEHSMNASDIARFLGVDRSQGARLVNGDRNLTITQISKLSEKFGVEPGVFISASRVERGPKRRITVSSLKTGVKFSIRSYPKKSVAPLMQSFPTRDQRELRA